MSKQEQAGHLPALDGVRGIAILLVMIYHLNLMKPAATAAEATWTVWCDAGWVGVDLFFVLSGFLITGILLDGRGEPAGLALRRFWARRVLRIFPLYYALLLVSFAVLPALASMMNDAEGPVGATLAKGVRELLGVHGSPVWFWLFVPNFLIAAQGFVEADQLNATWTLGVEEQFYLCWPFVVRLVPRRALPTVLVLVIIGALTARLLLAKSGAPWQAAVVLPWCRADALALGGLLALAVRDEKAKDWCLPLGRFLLAGGILSVVTLAASTGSLHQFDRPVYTYGLSLLALAAGGLVVGAVAEPKGSPLRLLLERPFLTTCGKYAYGLYLLHVPVLHLVVRLLVAWLQELGLLTTRFGTQLFVTTSGVLLTLLLAALVYHLYEAPFLRLKRSF